MLAIQRSGYCGGRSDGNMDKRLATLSRKVDGLTADLTRAGLVHEVEVPDQRFAEPVPYWK